MKDTYKRVESKCCDCGTPITIAECKLKDDIRKYGKIGNHRCKECWRKWKSNSQRKWYDSLSEEGKESITSGMKKFWETASDDQKEKIKKDNSDRIKNMPEKERIRISKIESEAAKKYWSLLSDEERDIKASNASIKRKEWWDNLSIDERTAIIGSMRNGWKTRYDNLSEEDKIKYANQRREIVHNYWINLPDSAKIRQTKSKLIAGHGRNKFHQLFEDTFNKLLINSFSYEEEFSTSNNGIIHFWDYAIFHKNELVMLVDLDGVYFHADICDYDGIHSRLEYDEKRGLSIPDGVKCCIIYEKDFDKSFEYMKKMLPLSYDEYVEQRLREYRSMPFPYPEYSDAELLRSYRDLCKLDCGDKYHQDMSMNTRVGDRLIFHFHQSLFEPLIEAWNNDDVLRDMIKRGYLYHSYINRNKILQGFNIYKPCKRTRFISAGKAKMIIHRYLSAYNEIFCPVHNLGVMLACIVMNKHYTTRCNDEVLMNETNNMLTFLRDNGIEYDVTLQDASENHQCLFSEANDDILLKYK